MSEKAPPNEKKPKKTLTDDDIAVHRVGRPTKGATDPDAHARTDHDTHVATDHDTHAPEKPAGDADA
jgi:hypothetical protein